MSSWYAFMRFQESWYSYMGFLDEAVHLMYTMRPREYVYKKSEDGSLATHWSRLADVDSGSAVKTYRQLQIEKAHLPVELWESNVFDLEDPNA